MLLNRTPSAGLRGFCFAKAQPIRICLFRTFYEPSDQEFFITPKNNAIYKLYKNDRYYQLTGIGSASVDFPEGKIWYRPGKIR